MHLSLICVYNIGMSETNIGERIASLRKKRGFTQKDLGDFLGVTDKAISRWESGYGNPDITILPKLARLLGTTTDYLLSGEGPSSSENNSQKPCKDSNRKPLRVLMTLGKVFTVLGAVFFCLMLVIFSIPPFMAGQYALFVASIIFIAIDSLICLLTFDVLHKAKTKKDVIAIGVISLLFCFGVGGVLILCIPEREFYETIEVYETEPKKDKTSYIKGMIAVTTCIVGFACFVISIMLFGTKFFLEMDHTPGVNGYQVMFDYKNCYPLGGHIYKPMEGSSSWLIFGYFSLYVLALFALLLGLIWFRGLLKQRNYKRPSFKIIILLGTLMMVLGWGVGTIITSVPLYTEFAYYGIQPSPSIDAVTILTIVGANIAGVGFMIPLEKIKKKSVYM